MTHGCDLVVTIYSEGSLAGASATFTDVTGALADPTTVTANVIRPDGTLVPVTTTSTTVGVWTASWIVDQPGRWGYKFTGTGAVTASMEGALDVTSSRFDVSGSVVTVGDLSDLMVTAFTPQQVTAASMIIDGQIEDVAQYLDRPLYTETIIGERVPIPNPGREYDRQAPYMLSLRREPVLSISQIRFADGTLLDPQWYIEQPWGVDLWGLYWRPINPMSWVGDYSLYVDYTAGLIEARPDSLRPIRSAVLRAAQREMTLQLSGMRGLRGLSVDGGTHYVRDTATRLEDPGAGLNDGEKALISRYRRKILG